MTTRKDGATVTDESEIAGPTEAIWADRDMAFAERFVDSLTDEWFLDDTEQAAKNMVAAALREALSDPETVLRAAEKLLRDACHRSGYVEVRFHGDVVELSEHYSGDTAAEGPDLPAAFAALVRALSGGG